MRTRTIRIQLVISFLTIATLIIGSLSLITIGLTNNHFSKYVNERQENLLNQYVKTVDLLWSNNNETWNNEAIKELADKALEDNIYFSIEDVEKNIIWKLKGDELVSAQEQLKESSVNATLKSNVEQDSMIEKEKKLISQGTQFGSITFYYLGPFAYTEHDAMFLSGIKQSLLYVAIVAFVVSFLLASWIANRFARPLRNVSEFTKQLSSGEYSRKIQQETSISELNSLVESLNDLSNQLEMQDGLRKRLTSDISHELRTPLTTLKGSIEGMIDGVWEVTPNRLQSCYDEIDRLTRLIGNIELINKIETNYDYLEKTEFDMYKLAESVIENHKIKLAEKKITVNLSGDKTNILADKDKINQVLTNLLSNAIKFTQKEGRIEITITTRKEKIYLTVQDNGIGIDKAHQLHIFDRFYMVDPSRSSALGGQGIGLAIVKSIVEAHKGTIRVTSDLGLGTKFVLTLPLK